MNRVGIDAKIPSPSAVAGGRSSFAVVIVNFRTSHLVLDCLDSLDSDIANRGRMHVVVVDNDSRDGSVELIRQAVAASGRGFWITVVAADRNGGFASGNNIGIGVARRSLRDLAAIVLLNPDTIARPGCLVRLVDFLASRPKAGIVGASLENGEGGPEPSAHRFPSPLGELEGASAFGPLTQLLRGHVVTPPILDQAHVCDWVSGACLAIRREVLDGVGSLDEGYFLYFEEVDYCRRANIAGWECWRLPDATVVHLEGASTGIKIKRRRRPAYWYASRRRFFAVHLGLAGLLAADTLWSLGRASLVLRRALRLGGNRAADDEPLSQARDLLTGDIKALLRGELGRRTTAR